MTPGRMSWLTAVDFVLIASALILLGTRRAMVATQILATTVGLSALVAIGAYVFGEPDFLGAKATQMAVHTALGFLLLAVGAVTATRDRGVVPRVRRQLAIIGPVAAAVFLVLSWILRAAKDWCQT